MRITKISLLFGVLSLVACQKKVDSAIRGKWTMPHGDYMGYSLALTDTGGYTRWFWSDHRNAQEIQENPKTGSYSTKDGWVSIPVEHHYIDGTSTTFTDRFKREKINDVEVMLREDSEEIWRRCRMIYTGGLLIKVSDNFTDQEWKDESNTDRLFRNGVKEWSEAAEAEQHVTR